MLKIADSLGKKEKMSSKERVKLTFNLLTPDRVPIDYSANPGIDARLKAYFGLAPHQHEELRQVLGVDFRHLAPAYIGPRLHQGIPGRRIDPAWGIHELQISHGAGAYWEPCDFPLKDADEERVAEWPMPSPDNFDYHGLVSLCKAYGDYAVSCHIGAEIINFTSRLRSMEEVLVDLITDNAAGLLLIDRIQNTLMEVATRSLEATKGLVDFAFMGQDLGTQKGPLISMDLFRRHIRPRLQSYVDIAKGYELPVMIHSCGSSSWAFEDFIDMGISGVDTLQPEAAQMSPQYLIENFGGRLVFHGCISTAGPVSFGLEQDVIEDVKRILAFMMPAGGYCFSPTHMLQDNSPVENVVAMYRAVHQYGWY